MVYDLTSTSATLLTTLELMVFLVVMVLHTARLYGHTTQHRGWQGRFWCQNGAFPWIPPFTFRYFTHSVSVSSVKWGSWKHVHHAVIMSINWINPCHESVLGTKEVCYLSCQLLERSLPVTPTQPLALLSVLTERQVFGIHGATSVTCQKAQLIRVGLTTRPQSGQALFPSYC